MCEKLQKNKKTTKNNKKQQKTTKNNKKQQKTTKNNNKQLKKKKNIAIVHAWFLEHACTILLFFQKINKKQKNNKKTQTIISEEKYFSRCTT